MVLVLLILLLLYLLAVHCRGDHPGMEGLRGWSYAHRGLHGNGVPENSMAAFRAALDRGYGIELDVHLLQDGNLAVIHDSLLARTTGAEGRVEDLATRDLGIYHLDGTEETIPAFSEVLSLYAGKAPLIVELKPADDNQDALAEIACNMLETYPGPYCVESFDPRCVYWLKKHRPEVIRGQLSENYFRTSPNMHPLLRFALTHNLLNFLTVPDFIAYRVDHRKHTPSNFLCRKFWRAQGVSWTIRSQKDYDAVRKEGWLPIFEGFLPE